MFLDHTSVEIFLCDYLHCNRNGETDNHDKTLK